MSPATQVEFGLDMGEHGLPLLTTKKSKWNKVITILHHVSGDVQRLSKVLRDALGTGGRVRGSTIELMGDQREAKRLLHQELLWSWS